MPRQGRGTTKHENKVSHWLGLGFYFRINPFKDLDPLIVYMEKVFSQMPTP